MNPKWTLWLSVLLCLCLLIPFGAVAEESEIDGQIIKDVAFDQSLEDETVAEPMEDEAISQEVEEISEEITLDLGESIESTSNAVEEENDALEENPEAPAVENDEAVPEEELLGTEQTIVSFETLSKVVFPVGEKPADQAAAIATMAQQGLKNEVAGKLSGYDETWLFNVSWVCANYSATSESGEYTFTAAFDGEEFTLAEGVKMPSVILKVVSDDEFQVKANEDGTLTITGWNAADTETALVIPAKIDGVDVTEVSGGAFKGHPDINSVTLTDNLRNFPVSAFDDGIKPETVKLVAYGVTTTLKSEKSFSQMIKAEEVTTTLPWALTDIEAATGNLLTISYDLTVEEGHALLVDSEATVVINEGKTLTNCGSVTGDGEIDNFGAIYSCQMESAYSVTTWDRDSQPYEPITYHAFGSDGRCEHCHAKKLYFSAPVTITKVYDGSNTKTLTSSELANFTITNRESSENISIIAGEATFNGETVGSHQVRVDLEIDEGAQLYDYLWDAVTVNGTIQARSITDSGITISDIPNQSQSGTNPSVTVRFNGETMVLGTDYALSHSYNLLTGEGTVNIMGIGNFTGTRTKPFTFDKDEPATKTDRTVSISLKAGHEPTKVYDRTINVSLKASDFTISGVASGDTVRISKISASYDSRDAGDRKVNITFEISQSSTQYNYVLANSGKLTINGKITRKSISDMDVSLDPVTIANQKWTGSAIKPAVGLKYQDKKLKEGTDYTVTYSSNVKAGLATVELTGIGNYEGTRKTQFRILKAIEDMEYAPPTSIAINDTEKTLYIGYGRMLNVTMTTEEPGYIPDTVLTWKSDKPGIIAVDKSGKVTAKKVGTATITVTTANRLSASITMTVVDPFKPTDVSIEEPGFEYLGVKDSAQLNAILTSEKTPASAKLTWKSSASAVAGVDKNGKVTGKKPGTATITVTTDNKLSASVEIEVKDIHAPESIEIVPVSAEYIPVKGTLPLSVTMTAIAEPQTKLTWKSSKPAVASVDRNGLVTGKKPGTATITVTTANKLSASVEIEVKDIHAPESIEIVPVSAEYIPVKEKLPLSVTMTAIAEPRTKLTWKSSKPAIANVDRNGVVTGKKAGTATITVTTANKLSASIDVEVVDTHAPTAVRIVPETVAPISVKGTAQLSAQVEAIDTPTTRLTWKSDNPRVASVSSKGLVTGKKAGTATITVTTGNKLSASITIEVK